MVDIEYTSFSPLEIKRLKQVGINTVEALKEQANLYFYKRWKRSINGVSKKSVEYALKPWISTKVIEVK